MQPTPFASSFIMVAGVGTLGHRYEVTALLTEVSPQEGLLQAFDSLQTLDAAINDVFNRIQSRISSERAKITAVVGRVARAQAKVAEVGANSTRVTTIFSTAKYPAPKVLADFKRVLDVDLSAVPPPADNDPEQQGLFLAPTRTSHRIATKDRFAAAPPADTSVLFTSLTTARLMRSEHESAFNEEQELAEGLGRLPSYLPSISSVLLFNSDENPYKQYVSINNLEGVGGQDRAQDSVGPSAAPKSLIDGLELPTYAGFTFEYKPMLGEMPTFDLPQNLPLGKLADITFGVEQGLGSIAPSMATLSLPSLDMLALPMPSRPQQQSAVPSYTPVPAAAASSSASSVPAAPSAPSAPSAPVPSAPAAPAAPPMAVPSAPAPPNAPPPPAPQGVPAAVAKPAGGRGALLDAIRDAKNSKKLKPVAAGPSGAGKPTGGRAGLKSAAARPEGAAAAAAAKPPPPSDAGGDMMAALRERMVRRQQAMSGKGEVEVKAPAPSALQRRVSVAPRLGAQAPAAGGKAAPGSKVKISEEAEGADDEDDSKMSSAVLSAYVSAHAKKQDKDEEWGE